MLKPMKKTGILPLICVICLFMYSCNVGSSTPEGTYYFSRGNENGKIVVDKNKDFVITGKMGYEQVYYIGGIDSQNKLRIRGGNIPYEMLGIEFGEWEGNKIVSGGWIFIKK